MIRPSSPRFLDVRFKRLRWVWWRYLDPTGRWSRRGWARGLTFAQQMARLEQLTKIRDCKHANRRPNPKATAVLDWNPEVCLDCGVGIVHRPAS